MSIGPWGVGGGLDCLPSPPPTTTAQVYGPTEAIHNSVQYICSFHGYFKDNRLSSKQKARFSNESQLHYLLASKGREAKVAFKETFAKQNICIIVLS